LGVVGGNPSELWDCDVSTILVDISVNINVDGLSKGRLNSFDDVRDDGALQIWDQISSNSGGESTGKGDINIVRVDLEYGLLDLEKWGLLGSDLLLGDVYFDIEVDLGHFDGGLS